MTSSSHHHPSPQSFTKLVLVKSCSSSNWDFSHSNMFCLQLSVHSHSPSFHWPTFPRSSFCWLEIMNNLGNLLASVSSPNQLSSQNFAWFPSPIFHLIYLSNYSFGLPPPHDNFKSFHHNDAWHISPSLDRPLQPPYLDLRTSTHKESLPPNKVNLHLAIKATLYNLTCLMPRPPCSFGQHTLSQLTKQIFLFSSSPSSQRKFLCMEIIFLATMLGNLNKDK